MKMLYRRLRPLGLTKPYIQKHVLPSWWDDDAALTPAGLGQVQRIIARNLGIELQSLRDSEAEIKLKHLSTVKFKKASNISQDELGTAQAIGERVARYAAAAINPTSTNCGADSSAIRDKILEEAEWVSLQALLEYCWKHGIAVLHLSGFPKNGVKKMAGFATRVNEHPVIVLTSNHKKTAWLLFDLAHELGHIVLGHVSDGEILVDAEIDSDSTESEEEEANDFACELLTGSSHTRYRAGGTWPKATSLASQARIQGSKNQTDPGHIVLNYGRHMGPDGFWGVAQSALNILEPNADAPNEIREMMFRYLDWSQLPADASEFLAGMTGVRERSKQC